MKNININTYTRLNEEIPLGSQGDYFTYWENVPFLTNHIREDLDTNNLVLNDIDKELRNLKSETAWLRGEHSKCLMSLYDLYEFFLDSRVKFFWHYNHDNIHVSTFELDGKFTKMTDLKWFHRDIYKKFVLRQILLNPILQNRSFRVKTRQNCLVKIKNEYKISTLDQITDKGFIIKLKNVDIVEYLKTSTELKFILAKIPGFLDFELKASINSELLLRANSLHNLKNDALGESFLFIPFLDISLLYSEKSNFESFSHLNEMNQSFLNTIQENLKTDCDDELSLDLAA